GGRGRRGLGAGAGRGSARLCARLPRRARGLADAREAAVAPLQSRRNLPQSRDAPARVGAPVVGPVMWDFGLVDRFEDLEPLQVEWAARAAHSDFVGLFSTFGFARAWWSAFGDGKLLRAITARRSGALRLVAPMWTDRSTPGNWRFLGSVRADYNNV